MASAAGLAGAIMHANPDAVRTFARLMFEGAEGWVPVRLCAEKGRPVFLCLDGRITYRLSDGERFETEHLSAGGRS